MSPSTNKQHQLTPDLDPLVNADAGLGGGRAVVHHVIEGVAEVESLLLLDKLGGELEEVVDEERVDLIEGEIVGVVGVPLHVVPDTAVQTVKILLV